MAILLYLWMLTALLVNDAHGERRPRDHKVMERKAVSFFCPSPRKPATEIYWMQGERIVRHTWNDYIIYETPEGSALRIKSVKASRDNTTFSCVIYDEESEIRLSAQLHVYPNGQTPAGYPEIVESPHLKAVSKGRNTIMVCEAKGLPSPDIMWLKDAFPIDLQDSRLSILPSGSLQIIAAQESDHGRYKCVAENSVGVAYSNGAHLYVIVPREPPYFSVAPEPYTEVMQGASVNLTCEAVGSPMPYVKWQLGSVQLTDEDSIPIGQNTLELTTVQQSATYTCVASSDIGIVEASSEVHVMGSTAHGTIQDSAPYNIRSVVVGSSTVVLQWEMSTANDTVKGYQVMYTKNDHLPLYYWNIQTVLNDRVAIVSDLDGYERYTFAVSAFNDVGASPLSERHYIYT